MHVKEAEGSFTKYPHRYWHCCRSKKGYSGVALFSIVEPISVSYTIGIREIDCEGRVITAEFDNFYVVATYVPSSGKNAVRMDYRVRTWDEEFRNHLLRL
jgi:exonuclease III